MPIEIVIFPILGVVAGLVAGLLGLGGGIVIVPVLIFTFALLQFSDSVLTHLAVGTSLATIVITSLGSVRQHHAKGAVRWDVLKFFAIGLMLGAYLGAEVADVFNGRLLQMLFGIFAIIVAFQMMMGLKPSASRHVPGPLGLSVTGVFIGVASAIFGIGGGSLMVPFLSWCNVKMQHAVGTSSAGGMPIAIAGTAGFIVTGWQNPALPDYSLGFVYLPAFLGIGITSVVFAQIGAKFAHRLPSETLKKCFGGLLIAVGIKLIVG